MAYAVEQVEGSNTVEIWVATGTYKPDESAANPTGSGSRAATFSLHNNVKIYGGFAGSETDKNARNCRTNVCVLDGHLEGDDDPLDHDNPDLIDDNSYHVLSAINVSSSALIDGFTVTRGNAIGAGHPNGNGAITADSGGGLVIVGGNSNPTYTQPVTVRCKFVDNRARVGGAVFMRGGNQPEAQFWNCEFIFNNAYMEGSGTGRGGACAFEDIEPPSVEDEEFVVGAHPKFFNCLFVSNGAEADGGAIYAQTYSVITLTNCTLYHNGADTSGALFHAAPAGCSISTYGQFAIQNCIIWNNLCDQCDPEVLGHSIVGRRELDHSCVQFGPSAAGSCVIAPKNTDPLFVDPNYGDYRLQCGSPCINQGNSGWVPNDDFDLNQNGFPSGRVPDLQQNPRIVFYVDMGAYEVPEAESCYGDINNDGNVGTADLLAVINAYGACPSPPTACPADVGPRPCLDGTVGVPDILVVITTWGECPVVHEDYPTGVAAYCMDYATNELELEPYSEEWITAVKECMEEYAE